MFCNIIAVKYVVYVRGLWPQVYNVWMKSEWAKSWDRTNTSTGTHTSAASVQKRWELEVFAIRTWKSTTAKALALYLTKIISSAQWLWFYLFMWFQLVMFYLLYVLMIYSITVVCEEREKALWTGTMKIKFHC